MKHVWRLTAAVVAFVLSVPFGGIANAANYAGLVIRHGDGSVVTRCVSFEEPSISGSDLLYRSGLSIDANSSGYGVSIYGIDGEGTAEDWSSGRASWSYWHLRGSWVFSPVGASSYSVKNGDVEGWAWGSQTSPNVPPVTTFDQIYRDTYGEPVVSNPPPSENTPPTSGTTQPQTSANESSTKTAGQTSAVSGNTESTSSGSNSIAGTDGRAAATTTTKALPRSTALKDGQSNLWDYLIFGLILAVLVSISGYYYRRNKAARKTD